MQGNERIGKANNSRFLRSMKIKPPKTDPNNEEKKTRAGHGERGPLVREKYPDLVSEEDKGMENNL